MSRRRRGGEGRARLPRGVRRVATKELRWRCSPRTLAPVIALEEEVAREEQAELEQRVPDPARRERLERRRRLERPRVSFEEIVGQERAREAIATGLSTEAPGFHVFVCGPPGVGRRALAKAALQRFAPPLPRPRDRVYVANFQHPERPILLTLPRGKGRHFRRDVDDMLAVLRRAIPAALGHELHVAKCERIRRHHDQAATRLIEDLAAELRPQGLIVGPIPEGFGTPELRIDTGEGGEPLPRPVVERRLAKRKLRATPELEARMEAWPEAMQRLEEVAGQARERSRRGTLSVRRLDADVARQVAQGFADDLARDYPAEPVGRWLRSFLDEVGEAVDLFLEQARDEEREEGERREDLLAYFRANLFVDAMERPVPPLIFEPNPSYVNLFGSLEPSDVPADHLRLRAGSLMQANGGVLVVDAWDLFHDDHAWGALKRAVRSGWLEVQSTGSTTPGSSLRPQPIAASFKLVAIGSDDLFENMQCRDPAFDEVFKVKVQLEDSLPRREESVQELARGLLRVSRRAGLLRPDAQALARLVEHSARLSGRRDRLAPSFEELLDVVQEADRLARRRGRPETIRARHVEEALARRRRRHDLPERRVQRDLDDRIVLLDCDGGRTGVINALVVYDTGDHVFARPSRITAAVGMGREGLVDVEREGHFSGDTHHKGVAIVAGLFRERYAQDKPLCLTATVCFEQSYAIVDGDSASAAEVVAVVSALAGMPIDQAWGVTGSINQKGEIQAVGDVNHKVEGYFDVCAARGLTGRQGVVIPAANVRDLMLKDEVVKAVSKGRFQVVAVDHLDQALELLLGAPAGARDGPLARYPEGSINAQVDAKLTAYAEAARRYGSPLPDGGPRP